MLTLDVNKLLDSPIPHPIIKKAIRKLKKDGYYLPGDFFRKLTDHESEVIGEWATVAADDETPESEKEAEYSQLILLAQILSFSESVHLDTEQDVYKAVRGVIVMSFANHLHRKGLARCHYDNLTFGPEGEDLVVMERLDDK